MSMINLETTIQNQSTQILVAEFKENTPLSMRRAIIKLTDSCQLACVYCVNTDGLGKLATTNPDTIEDILARFKPKEIEFTGGEPAFHYQLLREAIKRAKKHSDFIMINTNLELLDLQRLKELERDGLSHLHFALHTTNPETHKQIRGNPHADINKVKTNIITALENTDLRLIAEYVPMTINLHDFSSVYDYIGELRKRFGGGRVLELEVGRLIPKGRANGVLTPSMEEQLTVLESIGKPTYPVEVFCFGRNNAKRLEKSGFQIYPCDAGEGMFYFDVDGRVLADNFSGFEMAKDFRKFEIQKIPTMHCPFR